MGHTLTKGIGRFGFPALGLGVTLAAASCSSLAPYFHRALTGHVRVVANLYDPNGTPMGQRRIEGVDGVRVYLLRDGLVDSTRTVAGQYRFEVGPGRYMVVVGVQGVATDSTDAITVTTSDIATTDTLALETEGGMASSPNPFSNAVSIRFGVQSAVDGTLQLTTLAGTAVHTLYAGHLVAGYHIVNWDGRNGAGELVAAAPYAVTLHAGDEREADVIIREP